MTDRAPVPTAPSGPPGDPTLPSFLLTVTGPDRPGVTAALFTALQCLGCGPVEVVDVEQVVVHVVTEYGTEVTTLIERTVKGWDGADAADKRAKPSSSGFFIPLPPPSP